MHINDAEAFALLVIGGCERKAADQAVAQERRRKPAEPRPGLRRERVERRRRRQPMHPVGDQSHEGQSSALRNAAAAASGMPQRHSTTIAARKYKGASTGTPVCAARTA